MVAAIWLPFNFGLLDSIWEWPAGQAAYVLNTPLAVDIALLLFVAWRQVPRVPLRWTVTRQDLKLVATMLVLFMAISLPFGLATGFLQLNPKLELTQLLGQPFGIFFFIAVPEELLFRGLLQGLLLERTGRPRLSLVVASLLFGVSHWHNPGMPDCRYLGLAAVAGGFYGFAYLRARSLAVPALLHTAVDVIWALLLHT
jgi:membrane protease YdiL (CAAX protease family)